jgi:exoribonuclease R
MKNDVISLLNRKFDALTIQEIYDELGLNTAAEMTELISVLGELVNSYAVYETKKAKYILYEHCPNFKKGVIQLSKTGSGFLLQNGKDIHIDLHRISVNKQVNSEITAEDNIGIIREFVNKSDNSDEQKEALINEGIRLLKKTC